MIEILRVRCARLRVYLYFLLQSAFSDYTEFVLLQFIIIEASNAAAAIYACSYIEIVLLPFVLIFVIVAILRRGFKLVSSTTCRSRRRA